MHNTSRGRTERRIECDATQGTVDIDVKGAVRPRWAEWARRAQRIPGLVGRVTGVGAQPPSYLYVDVVGAAGRQGRYLGFEEDDVVMVQVDCR